MLLEEVDVVARMSPILGLIKDDIDDIWWQLLLTTKHSANHTDIEGRWLIRRRGGGGRLSECHLVESVGYAEHA